MSINWYPGHMYKATREMKEALPNIDIIIEVLDARIPYSSENPVIQQLRVGKPCIKLLNKQDLADPALTQSWLQYFEEEAGVKAMAISLQEPERIKSVLDLCRKLVPKKEEDAQPIYAMITGIPNVGKSTLINSMAGRMIAKTGNEPAITKGQQHINLHNGIILVDTPGILWPKVENEKSAYRLATSGAIKETAISYDDVAFFAADYLLANYSKLLQERYKIDVLPEKEIDFLEMIGRKKGCLVSGNRVDFDKVSRLFIGEFRDGTLGKITLESPAMAIDEKEQTRLLVELKAAEKKAKTEARRSRSRMKKES